MALKNKLRKRSTRDPQLEPQEAPSAPAMPIYETVADTLRATREGFQLELADVAHMLNIRRVYLEAIEAGQFDALPGTTYAVGFVRAYSEYLGLDGAEMVRRFKEEERGLERQTQLNFPTPVPESRLPSGALILISLFCLGLAYAGWSYVSSSEGDVADLIPEVPDRLMALVTGDEERPAAPVVAETDPELGQVTVPGAPAIEDPVIQDPLTQISGPQSPVALDTDAQDPAPLDLEAESRTATAPKPAEPSAIPAQPAQPAPDAPTATVESTPDPAQDPALTPVPTPAPAPDQTVALDETIPAAPAAPEIPLAPASPELAGPAAESGQQVYGAENSDSRVTLKASQDSWVQVRDSRDGLLMARVLRAGETYRVPNEPGITMVTGNAGGLEILVDGTSLGTMGPVGSVRRDVALEPSLLLSGQPTAN